MASLLMPNQDRSHAGSIHRAAARLEGCFSDNVGKPMSSHRTEVVFLGTRGEIPLRSRQHRWHSSLLICSGKARVMIDCGADWLGRVRRIAPTAIVLTHAHADHAAGLARGAPCPVYATSETLALIARYPLHERRRILPERPFTIDHLVLKAIPVAHSLRAPAVGYRIKTDGGFLFFYVPDIADLPDPSHALRGVVLYIGDGATVKRSMVRKRPGAVIGHAAIAAQLDWCAKARVGNAIFTHCGSGVVRGKARTLNSLIGEMGRASHVDARFACDGDRLMLSGRDRFRWYDTKNGSRAAEVRDAPNP